MFLHSELGALSIRINFTWASRFPDRWFTICIGSYRNANVSAHENGFYFRGWKII